MAEEKPDAQEEKVIIISEEGRDMPTDKFEECEAIIRRIRAMKSSNRILKYWGIRK